MERSRKEMIVGDLHDAFSKAGIVVVAHNNGLTVAEATALRRTMRAEGAEFRVTKNRLALRAIAGTPYSCRDGLFRGPTAVALSEDPLAAARAAAGFAAANDRLALVGGAMSGTLLDPEGVKRLAELPPIETLRASLVALLVAPAARTAGLVKEPAARLARIFGARAASGSA